MLRVSLTCLVLSLMALLFVPLAIGPFLGVWAMATLRADPGSLKLAGGRR